MPNQYAKVMYTAKGEEIAQNDNDHSYGLVDALFEEAIRGSSFHESEKDVAYGFWSLDNNALTTLSISNSLHTL
jgi:hypothetical protein